MEKLSGKLNIKGHYIENEKQRIFINGPFDMEGHTGMDGRYYLLDFSRLFPSEPPRRGLVLNFMHCCIKKKAGSLVARYIEYIGENL